MLKVLGPKELLQSSLFKLGGDFLKARSGRLYMYIHQVINILHFCRRQLTLLQLEADNFKYPRHFVRRIVILLRQNQRDHELVDIN